MKAKIFVLLLSMGTSTFSAVEAKENHTDEKWSIGAAVSHSQSPYKSYDNDTKVWPMLNYSKGKFFIRGKELGFEVWKSGAHKVDLGVSYYDLEFKRKDTSNAQLKMLDNRKATMMADISYSFASSTGGIKLKTSFDILDKSNGLLLDISYRYRLEVNKNLKLNPGLGLEWANKKQNDYYYGIASTEAMRSGLPSYSAKSGLTPYLFLEARYDMSKKLNVFVAGRINFLSSEIKDSPMVGKSTTTSVAAGLQYSF